MLFYLTPIVRAVLVRCSHSQICQTLFTIILAVLAFSPPNSAAEELGAAASRDAQIKLATSDWSLKAEAALRTDLAFFCDDALKGRDVGSDGLEQAATYIAESFAHSGLNVNLFSGKPLQTFSLPVAVSLGPADQNQLELVRNVLADDGSNIQPIRGELDRTFRPLAIGGSGSADAPLVFAGYGITAPEFGYDDYAKVDVRGQIVLILRKEPSGQSGDGRFGGSKNSRHAYFETKIRNAAAHGAVAVLLVNDSESIREASSRIENRISDETRQLNKLTKQLSELPEEAVNSRQTLRLRRDTISTMLEDLGHQRIVAEEGLIEIGEAGEKPIVEGLPVVSISRQVANQLLRTAGWESLDATSARIARTGRPSSTLLFHRVKLQTMLNQAIVKSSNVIGVLEGKGSLVGETVVVGAHYDHVGMGGAGSLAPGTVAIHNGADDNASGTAALLSSAPRIRELLANVASHRRVVFIAFTGEERGLLGSEYYVRHPRFPLESTVAMINLDMVGRLRDNDLTVYGTGSASELDGIVEAANETLRFKLFKVPSGFGPSDHQSFYLQKIPVLFFFTGLHNDYHRPSDDLDKINFNGLTRITDITSVVAAALASRPDRLHYAATNRDVSIRWQATAYLGVQLRETTDNGGVIVSGVTPGGAAEKAGILIGDRIQKFDDSPVKTVGEVLETLRSRNADDPLRVELQRGIKLISVVAILQNRPG